jgi:hypothetical protein
MNLVVAKRLVLAMAAYVALAALAFLTLPDHRIRGVTLAILAMFALKTWVRRNELMHADGEGDAEEVSLREGAVEGRALSKPRPM